MDKRIKMAAILSLICVSMLFASCFGKGSEAALESDDIQNDLFENNNAEPVFQQTDNAKGKYEKIAHAGDNIPISRALVAKMLAYINNDSASINAMERIIKFTDTTADAWYDRYINAVVTQGYMSGGGTEFMPDKPLTLGQAQMLLDKADPNNKVKIQINDANKDKAISYALWTDLYYELLFNLSGDKEIEEQYNIKKSSVIVLATPWNNSKLKAWNMITSTGALSYKGLSMDDYIDKKIGVLKKDGEVIAFLGVIDYAPIIKNAYIVSITGESITVFSGGAERTYFYRTTGLTSGDICDIKINGSNAENVKIYSEKLSGIVRKANADIVEVDGHGQLKFADEAKIYSVHDGVPKWKTISALVMGTDISEYVISDGKVIAIIITKSTLPETIRVALNTSGFKGILHDNVNLTCDKQYKVRIGKNTKTYNANEEFAVVKDDKTIFKDGITRIYIEPSDNGKIQINSIKREWFNNESPKYRGKIEIGLEDNGLTIINELSMDEYLYAVVPSEMPSGHGLEAAKVQAVTARSYAYNQYYSNRFYKYGANIDDSVSCQVYNNAPENEISIKAVDETTGQCLVYNGSVISANFFSTSSGMTANAGEVWANSSTKQFPDYTQRYLSSVKQYTDGDYGDLKIEENAYKFFKENSVKGYDSDFAWFRWSVEMTAEEISASINGKLKSRYDANPRLIQTLNSNNVFCSVPISSIGTVTNIEVVERGEGGNITKMKITGTNATILVLTEYNIRVLLKPAKTTDNGRNIVITRKDGTKIENYSLLPSAFFVMDKTINDDGSMAKVLFSGGGNGHGVGMSQNGVKGMIDAGYKFDGILKHYYKDTEVKKMI